MFYFDDKREMKRLSGYKNEKCGTINSVPNIIFQTSRPANGFGGVLYPKHSFSDKRFFNEELFMNLSPTSDESWQYTFNVIENKILRQTSIIIDNSVNIVENNISLVNIPIGIYEVEVKTNDGEIQPRYIVISENIYKS